MSGLAQQVSLAINSAKQGLGDLVVPAILKQAGAKTYVNGKYVTPFVDVPIEGVLDKFDYMEMQNPDISQNDLKFNVFNPFNDLIITNGDSIFLHEVIYAVNRIVRVYVGTLVPVFTLYLRK